MIPHDVEVFLALEPVNMHLSFDRLAALVTEQMGRSARDPALYVFLNRRRTLLKALFFDGTGLCVFYKRLDRGRFRLPEPVDDGGVVEMSEEELERLLDGLTPAKDTGDGGPPPTLH
jgi:transposase